MPHPAFQDSPVILHKDVAAFEIVPDQNGKAQMGTCLQLAKGSPIEICGAGFSERTVRVRSGQNYYFVLMKSVLR